ncbi:MAG: hypothetical protein AB1Z98_32210 [Nannocystaceae bacterium]
MRDHSLRISALSLFTAAALMGLACGDDGSPPAADSTGDASSGTTTSGSVSATSQGTNSGADTTAAGTSSSGGNDDVSFVPADSSGGPLPPQPNGSPCDGRENCESGYCYQVPTIGGVCSDCVVDSDCEMGTCSLDVTLLYAVCTDGGIGVMCGSDEGCMGDLVCAELLDTGGIFPLDFCSECRDDVPCTGDQICSPVYDLAMFQGYLGCVDPSSVPNGGGCPVDGVVGDGTVCQSGLCGVATLAGVIPVGVCGECLTDMDCMGPQTCQPPAADMSGLMPATCI